MFLGFLVFVMNIKKSIANPVAKNNMKTINECAKELYNFGGHISRDSHMNFDVEKIARILFETILDRIKFPLKRTYFPPKTNKIEIITITREDLKYEHYWAKLINGIVRAEGLVAKEQRVDFEIYYIALYTQGILEALICMDFNGIKIDKFKIQHYIDKVKPIGNHDDKIIRYVQFMSKDDLKNIDDLQKSFNINESEDTNTQEISTTIGYQNNISQDENNMTPQDDSIITRQDNMAMIEELSVFMQEDNPISNYDYVSNQGVIPSYYPTSIAAGCSLAYLLRNPLGLN
ncbi:uncharacterized protein VNE69_11072 [Vairimorpha necatrix]|uniref:Uncharacterized protein n=1 Tax=Vairimorpha necatrix TaxID=6039 RepID=A0AAX4JG28_9MICR